MTMLNSPPTAGIAECGVASYQRRRPTSSIPTTTSTFFHKHGMLPERCRKLTFFLSDFAVSSSTFRLSMFTCKSLSESHTSYPPCCYLYPNLYQMCRTYTPTPQTGTLDPFTNRRPTCLIWLDPELPSHRSCAENGQPIATAQVPIWCADKSDKPREAYLDAW